MCVFVCVLQARKMNESGLFNPPLPSLGANDFLYIPHTRESYTGEWVQAFLAVVGGGAPVEYRDAWGASLSPTNWVCFKNAVISGTFPATVRRARPTSFSRVCARAAALCAYACKEMACFSLCPHLRVPTVHMCVMCCRVPAQVPDMETGFMFRRDMYAYMNIKLPAKPPKKVLFWFRTPPLYRSILNTEEVLAVTNSYNLSYRSVSTLFSLLLPSPSAGYDVFVNSLCARGCALLARLVWRTAWYSAYLAVPVLYGE